MRLDDLEDAYPETRTGPILDNSSAIRPAVARPPRGGSLAEGSMFADRYRIIRKLGQGGMGAVYLAQDINFERRVALKIPNLRGAEPEFVERFIREARAMAQLAHHPNICKIIDVVSPRGQAPYLTMEFVQGKTLSEVLRSQGGQLPVAEAARIIAATARALGEVHSLGIVHRDLKPDNLMIREDGTPIIMDFGLARRDSDERITVADAVMGTLPYMSPEQATGDNDAIGPASDIYGLGVILYELVTGHKPFTGHGLVMINRIRLESPALPSTHRPGLDPRLESICLQAIAKPPAHRQASMEALAGDLEALLAAGESPTEIQVPEATPEPPRPVEPPPRAADSTPKSRPRPESKPVSKPKPRSDGPTPRRPTRVLVGVAAVVLVCAGWWLFPSRQTPEQNTGGTSNGQTGPVESHPDPGELPKDPVASPSVADHPKPGAIVAVQALIAPEIPTPAQTLPLVDPMTKIAPTLGSRVIPSHSTGMILRLITPDQFEMGSKSGETDERPVHDVRISRSFYLGKFEVNQAEYRMVTGRSPSQFVGDDLRPVESVSWIDAVRFCNLLSVKDGLPTFYHIEGDEATVPDWSAPGYRLPTEAEWEYACRAGSRGEFGPGDDPSDLSDVAWFGANSSVEGFNRTHSEPRKPGRLHKFELENMQGNVAEWCWDWYSETYLAGPAEDPTGPIVGEMRVVRGGSYNEEAVKLRPSARESRAPSFTARRLGFRVARNES